MGWLDKLERKYGKYAIKDLIKYIIGLNAVVYLLSMVKPTFVSELMLFPTLVMRGEIWRLFTFVAIPPNASPIFIFFVLYLSYMIGQGLEQYWGSFKFNLFYLFGVLGAIAASFISGAPATPTYLNLSLFLAFAYIYPDFTLMLFFILPVKMKYLSYLYWGIVIWTLITAPVSSKLFAVFSLLNVFIFFGKEYGRKSKSYARKRAYQSKIQVPVGPKHKCTICGVTEEDNPQMEFRYCLKCDGYYEYCMDHINDHEHIKSAD